MTDSLSQAINEISEIDRKLAQIDKKVSDNEFTDNMISMIDSLYSLLMKY